MTKGQAMSEHRTIKIEVFRDPSGSPACRDKSGVCCMYETERWGTIEICAATRQEIPRDGGWTKPVEGCPVWAKESDTPASTDLLAALHALLNASGDDETLAAYKAARAAIAKAGDE